MQPISLKALIQAKNECNKQCNQKEKVPDFYATTYATQEKAVQLSVQQPTGETELKLKYNILLKREKAGEIWMDDPKRTDEEYQKRLPLFNQILADLNGIIDTIGPDNCTAAERMNGFDIIPLLGEEVSIEELPEEWCKK